jgi:alditol oxidase
MQAGGSGRRTGASGRRAGGSGRRTNWAGNVVFGAQRFHRPRSVAELQRLVAGAARIRALGTGHSFSPLADTAGDQVTLAGLPPLAEVDTARGAITVSAGLRYSDITSPLDQAGRALANLASLPHICVAGACATGTHGSGDANGSLATAVSALEMVTADGDLVTVSRDDPGSPLEAMVVALGALGIVTRLTLDTVPAFSLRQYVYDQLPLEQVTGHFAQIMASGYSVSLFTRWHGPAGTHAPAAFQAWLKCRADPPPPDWQAPPAWMGGRLADGPRHPIPGADPGASTQQLGLPGPWDQRLPHFRPEFRPSTAAELQSEYLVPRERGVEGVLALSRAGRQLAPVLQICEIRTIAADQLWLSPAYQRACVGFHFTWVDDPPAVARAVAIVEEALAPLQARPHWGKLFGLSPRALAALYPRLADFRQLMSSWDRAGKFRNDLLDEYLPAPAA